MNIPPIEHKEEDRVFPLESDLKNQYERVFAMDFSKVLIHLGVAADRMARDRNAQAVTRGRHIYFRSDQYAPHTEEGQQLLAHELKHVQQFQSGQSMNAAEDIRALEDGAGEVESVLSSVNLHSLSKPVLSEDSETGSEDLIENLRSSQDGITSQSDLINPDESIDGFSGKKSTTIIRIHLDSGKTMDLTEAEYGQLLDDLDVRLGEYLEDKKVTLMPDEYQEFIKNLSVKMNLRTSI